jgi:hypothetical protein
MWKCKIEIFMMLVINAKRGLRMLAAAVKHSNSMMQQVTISGSHATFDARGGCGCFGMQVGDAMLR